MTFEHVAARERVFTERTGIRAHTGICPAISSAQFCWVDLTHAVAYDVSDALHTESFCHNRHRGISYVHPWLTLLLATKGLLLYTEVDLGLALTYFVDTINTLALWIMKLVAVEASL